MKPLLALALLFTSCTSWDAKTGKFWTNADSDYIDIVYPGSHLIIVNNKHSPVIHAYGSAGGRLIGAAAAGFIGYKAVQAGQDAVGVLASVAPVHYNRQTSRAATPKPSTLLHP